MHNTALAVLGNALQSALESHSSKLKHLLQSSEWTGDSGIIEVLLLELSDASHRLHDAYQAARCIRILLESSCDMRVELLERNVAEKLEEALLIGVSQHALLADECKEALDVISGM
jgi:hypothetical protein